MNKEISIDEQISLIHRIMADRMNLLAVIDGKFDESTVNRIEGEIEVLGSIIQTLKLDNNKEVE